MLISEYKQLGLSLSLHGRFYKKFASLDPTTLMEDSIMKEKERLKTFYKAYSKSMKEVRLMKKITTIEGYGKKVIS